MKTITTDTAAGELLRPVIDALEKVHHRASRFGVMSMAGFIALGVHRHLEGLQTLRAHVQRLLHGAPEEVSQPPLARSRWSSTLASKAQRVVLEEVLPPLLARAQTVLPDRLQATRGLGDRPVHAIDGTYQRESPHYVRGRPPKGGATTPKAMGC
jgi:hypothetical protein